MARQQDDGPASSNPVAANSDNAFIDRASTATLPTMPLPDPTATPAATGLRGYARLDEALRVAPGEPKSTVRDNWVLSLPDDPTDIEYTQFLRQAKDAAKTRLGDATAKPVDTGPMAPDMGSGADKIWRARAKALGIDIPETPPNADKTVSGDVKSAFGTVAGLHPPAKAGAQPQQDRVQKELDARDEGEQQRKYREKIADKPIIMGLQVSDNEALVGGGNPDNPGGTPDGYISQWAHQQGLSLDNEHAQRAARNGSWVYQGEVADPAGGPGFTRSVYVHLDDAVSQMAGMSMDQIKGYQRQMKNPETGVVDAELQALWKTAVATASNYARQGKKVTLDFIFQQLLAAKVKSGAGSGGGSGRFAGESAADMIGADYYQAMMQVLGDISGVKK